MIVQSIQINDIERAVHNEGQFISIIEDKTKKMYDSETMLKYGIKREALGVLAEICVDQMDASNADVTLATEGASISGAHSVNELFAVTATSKQYILVKPIASGAGLTGTTAIAGGYLIALDLVKEIAQPADTSTGEAFVEQLKKDVEIASDYSEGHSLNGNTLGATPENGLILVVKQGVMPNLEVYTQAGAFNGEKVALPTRVVVVPDFGSADSKIYSVLLDERGVRLHNTYRAVRENPNGLGDFLNLFFHTENTAFVSRNSFVRVYMQPSA